eukprot:560933-Pleurochrysis_carterae.AAC.1
MPPPIRLKDNEEPFAFEQRCTHACEATAECVGFVILRSEIARAARCGGEMCCELYAAPPKPSAAFDEADFFVVEPHVSASSRHFLRVRTDGDDGESRSGINSGGHGDTGGSDSADDGANEGDSKGGSSSSSTLPKFMQDLESIAIAGILIGLFVSGVAAGYIARTLAPTLRHLGLRKNHFTKARFTVGAAETLGEPSSASDGGIRRSPPSNRNFCEIESSERSEAGQFHAQHRSTPVVTFAPTHGGQGPQ